jgi:hypothetical protein
MAATVCAVGKGLDACASGGWVVAGGVVARVSLEFLASTHLLFYNFLRDPFIWWADQHGHSGDYIDCDLHQHHFSRLILACPLSLSPLPQPNLERKEMPQLIICCCHLRFCALLCFHLLYCYSYTIYLNHI